MATARARTVSGSPPASSAAVAADVHMVLAWLERRGTKRNRDGMARYAIHAEKAFGVSMTTMKALAKQLGRNHALARALWDTGWYEARMLVSFVGDPAALTAAEMDRWCREFDNWAICDTLCFHLYDKSPLAWRTVGKWARRRPEFERRAAFALLAALALHDKTAPESRFLTSLPLITRGADRPSQLREEGRELGVAIDRSSQPGLARGGVRPGDAARPVGGCHGALGGQGHAARSDQAGRSPPHRGARGRPGLTAPRADGTV